MWCKKKVFLSHIELVRGLNTPRDTLDIESKKRGVYQLGRLSFLGQPVVGFICLFG